MLVNLSTFLDPERIAARDSAQNAARSLESSQMLIQAQQLQDLNRRLDTSQMSLAASRQQVYDAERKADKLQNYIDMLEMVHGRYRGPSKQQRNVYHCS